MPTFTMCLYQACQHTFESGSGTSNNTSMNAPYRLSSNSVFRWTTDNCTYVRMV